MINGNGIDGHEIVPLSLTLNYLQLRERGTADDEEKKKSCHRPKVQAIPCPRYNTFPSFIQPHFTHLAFTGA